MSVSVDTVPTPAATTAASHGRGWALAGAVGGLTGLVGLFVTVAATDADTALFADNARYVGSLAGNEAYVWAYQIVTSLAAGCLAVFAAGLRRRLAAREPAGGLLPDVAAVGLLLTRRCCWSAAASPPSCTSACCTSTRPTRTRWPASPPATTRSRGCGPVWG